MSKLKHKISTGSTTHHRSRSNSSTSKQQPNPNPKPKSKPKNYGHKRPLYQQSLTSMFRKSKPEKDHMELLYSMKEVLRTTEFQDILDNCAPVKALYELVCKSGISEKLVFRCLDKYFHANTNWLWTHKYAPRYVEELFQTQFAQKIQEWIKDFYYFRKSQAPVGDLDFEDDESQSYSRSLHLRMVENKWKCKGLLLQGRNGVGKTCLLNAIAKSMRIRCFEYASDVDQLQKMKEMLEGSQSQCVNNIQNKAKQQQNNKLIGQNNSIAKQEQPNAKKYYFETKQPRRLQVFRDFSSYFPASNKSDKQSVEDNYYRNLFQSIDKSVIPYVLTTCRRDFVWRDKFSGESLAKLDVLEFVENSVLDLTVLYATVYQIQYCFYLLVSTYKKIRKTQIFREIAFGLENSKFEILDIFQHIRQLVIAANNKPLIIAKYLQFRLLPAHKMMGNSQYAVRRCFDNVIREIKHEIIDSMDSQGLINNMDWTLPTLDLHTHSSPASITTDSINMSQFNSSTQQKSGLQGLGELRRKKCIEAVEDHRIFENLDLHYEKYSQKWNVAEIPIKTHIQAKKKILRNLKARLSKDHQNRKKLVGFRVWQLLDLPRMLRKSRAPGQRQRPRQSGEEIWQTLSKVLSNHELQYMRKFSNFGV